MPLRHRIESHPETVQDLELACGEKLWEGLELLLAGHRGAGIYLLGYAAEMVLKNACFRIDRARPTDDVNSRLRPIREWARQHGIRIDPEKYHSLLFWCHVLRAKRRWARRPLSAGIDQPLVQWARRIYGIWKVDMRYQPDQALQSEAESVYNDVTWIYDHRLQLVV